MAETKVPHGRYASKRKAFRVDARGADPILHPATGATVGWMKPLSAEFAIFGQEFTPRDENGAPLAHDYQGRPITTASIRGNFWDSKAMQAENGWTDDETMQVLAQVELFCRILPGEVWKLDDPVLNAPWPTFDTQTDKNAIMFAIEGGMVTEALAYARQEKRTKVVSELEAHLAEKTAETQAEEALTAV